MLNFVYYECWACGAPFGISTGMRDAIRDNKGTLFCPRGCRLGLGESLQAKFDKEKLALQAQLNDANHARLVAEKEAKRLATAKRKVEQRIAHGVCPCCNKTFADVSNHMLTEHKDFRLPAGKPTKQIAGAA